MGIIFVLAFALGTFFNYKQFDSFDIQTTESYINLAENKDCNALDTDCLNIEASKFIPFIQFQNSNENITGIKDFNISDYIMP